MDPCSINLFELTVIADTMPAKLGCEGWRGVSVEILNKHSP